MVVQLETGLHAIVIVEFDEGEPTAFGGGFFLGCDADCGGGVLLKVLGEGLVGCGVGQVSLSGWVSISSWVAVESP